VGAVLFALVAAGLADFGALAQQVLGVLRAAGQEAGGQGANVGAVAVEADAADHHFHVLLLQAGGGAVLTGGNAGIEGVEEGLVLLVHGTRGLSERIESIGLLRSRRLVAYNSPPHGTEFGPVRWLAASCPRIKRRAGAWSNKKASAGAEAFGVFQLMFEAWRRAGLSVLKLIQKTNAKS
jgi:hypothetical protein